MTNSARPTASAVTVGIDIGGTKTHLRSTALVGGATRDLIVPSGGWRVRDWNADAAGLLRLVDTLADGAEVAAIGIGAHGCDDAAECMAFQIALTARTSVPLTVVNDAELMPLALGLHGQIGVVAGTGSIAVCRPTADRMLVVGGWGWIVSDEGSASSLVKEAVRVVCRHLDRSGDTSEPLVHGILTALEVTSIPRLGSTLNQLGGAAEVGRHATVVFDAADRGSLLAEQVISGGGRMLAELPVVLNDLGAGASHVVAGGSVIASQERLWEAFVGGLAEKAPNLTPHRFSGSPVEGACHLAASIVAASHDTASASR